MIDWPMTVRYVPLRIRWAWIFTGIFFALVAVLVATKFQDYGISWDEEVQNTYGQKLLSFYRTGFQDRSAMTYLNLFFYGGFFDLMAAIANLVSPFGVYQTRHLLGGIFMLFGLFGSWRLTRLLAGDRAALIAVMMLTVDPLLYGHSFMNPKDAPLAWLSIWVLYFACRAIKEGRPRWSTIVGFGISLGLAFGTRIVAAPLLIYVTAVLGFGALLHRFWPQIAPISTARMAIGLLAACPIAYVVMIICWPWAIQDPLNPIRAFHEFSNFPWNGWLLWDGEMVPATHLPRNYLPALLLYQLPEHTLAGLLFVVVAGIVVAWRRHLSLVADIRLPQYALLIQAAVVPVVGFVILRPTVYNGMRHFLFVVPPLVILAAIGWEQLLAAVTTRWRISVIAAGGVLGVLMFWQMARMIDLHPYEYVAYNRVVGGVAGASGRFELDYWDTSLAEDARRLGRRLAKMHFNAPPVVFVCGNRLSASAFLPKYVHLTWAVEEADYFISIVPSTCRGQVDVTKDRIVEVRRDNVTLSYVIDLDRERKKADAAAP